MSEVQHRHPPRGRGASRGGRGGNSFGARRGSPRTNGDFNPSQSFEDQGEIGQLKKKYADKLSAIKEIIPNWTDEDLVFALDENNGDVDATFNRISEGLTPQWDEVKKKNKDRSRSKVPEPTAEPASTAGRGGRGRGSLDNPRGGRGGRGADRGGRGGRGRGGAIPNGQKAPTTDDWGKRDASWDDNHGDTSTGHAEDTWDTTPAIKQDTQHGTPAPVNNIPAPTRPTPTWASLFGKPAPPPAPKRASPPPPPKVPVVESTPPVEPEPAQPEPESLPPPQTSELITTEPEEVPQPTEPEPEPEPEPEQEQEAEAEQANVQVTEQEPDPEVPDVPEIKTEEVTVDTVAQPLTEQNLEKVEDVAPPAPTGTAASTVNSSVAPPKSPAASTVPITQQAPLTPQTRHVGLSTPKFASARTASFTRRTLDQQEAVIMPGNHAIDRTTVQFGSLGLNGAAIDDDDFEVEPVREKQETVAPPAQSPQVAQPITALPPATPQIQVQPQPQQQVQQPSQQQVQTHVQQPPQQAQAPAVQDALPTPRQAPGLPAQPQSQQQAHPQHHASQPQLGHQGMTSQQQMNPQLSSQFNRFGAIDQSQYAQKPYESFQHNPPQQHTPQTQPALPQVAQSQGQQQQNYGYPTHHQQQQQHHQQTHPVQAGLGSLTSLPEQQYNYYNSDIQRAGAPGFSYYTNPYSQPTQDTAASLPRATSGMGSAAGEAPTQLPTAPSQATSRFGQVGEQTSGHATPSPGIPALQPTSQAPNPQQTAAHQQYPMQPAYYHPYYYMNQQFYPSYQTPFGKQQGLYTQPHQNFISQYTDHASSPAGLGGFGGPTSQGRETATGVNDYSRAAVGQAQQTHPQLSSGNFGGLPNFLNPRGIPDQQQQSGPQGQSDDNLKPFGDNKPPTGPASNVNLQGQPRPGSATSGAASLPQQATQPQGGMGYPHNHHLHGHQGHQTQQHSIAQGQGYGQYSMYGQYPSQYGAANSRQGASGWGQYGAH